MGKDAPAKLEENASSAFQSESEGGGVGVRGGKEIPKVNSQVSQWFEGPEVDLDLGGKRHKQSSRRKKNPGQEVDTSNCTTKRRADEREKKVHHIFRKNFQGRKLCYLGGNCV